MKARPILLLLALLVTAVTADAVDVLLDWSDPTTYTDGTPLPLSDITGYTVTTPTGPVLVTTHPTLLSVAPGYNCFFVVVTAANGESSPMGAPGSYVCQNIPTEAPPGDPVIICPQ